MSRVAVVGFGALGAGAAWALARRGHDVVVLERHGVANRVGSSAGASRIFRLAYPEVDYVSLCIDALALWRRLEAETGTTLYVRRGLLERGERALDYASALTTCDLAHRVLDGAETPALFPELVPRPGEPAVFSEEAGPILAASCQRALAARVEALGGTIRVARATAVEETASGVRVAILGGPALEADACVVAPGPWANELLAPLGLALPLRPEIGQVAYVGTADGPLLDRPCLIDHATDERIGLYAMPTPGRGYKLGVDTGHAEDFDPARDAPWEPSAGDLEALAGWLAACMPTVGAPAAPERCPWTLTPDADIVVDRRGAVVVMAGCSGHGYKLGPALGEVAADLVEGRPARPEARRLRLDRPGLAAEPAEWAGIGRVGGDRHP